jgi:hypothetical protein
MGARTDPARSIHFRIFLIRPSLSCWIYQTLNAVIFGWVALAWQVRQCCKNMELQPTYAEVSESEHIDFRGLKAEMG